MMTLTAITGVFQPLTEMILSNFDCFSTGLKPPTSEKCV